MQDVLSYFAVIQDNYMSTVVKRTTLNHTSVTTGYV